MKKLNKTVTLILTLLLTLSLCACGAKSQSADSGYYSAGAVAEYAEAEESMAYYDYDVPMEAPAPAAAAMGGFAADNSAVTADIPEPESSAADINPAKIIYSASASLETTTFDETLTKLSQLVSAHGGFIESSSVSGANYYSVSHGTRYNRSASYTIRIPGTEFQTVMNTLPTLGNVPYTNTYTDNITSQYYDVQAHVSALETQEARLLEMLGLAETVEDVITIEDRLADVRYQIESLQSRLNNWDRQVNYSTIYLDVSEVEEYTPTPGVSRSYGEKLADALKSGLNGIANFFRNALLWLAESLPGLLLAAAVLFGAVKLVLACVKNRGARKEKRAAKKAAKEASLPTETAAPVEEAKEE